MIYTNTKEGWGITVTTDESVGIPKEVALISINFPGGKKWEGSINDLQSIFSILENLVESGDCIRYLELCQSEASTHLQLHLNTQP